jgi:hypothetical protein
MNIVYKEPFKKSYFTTIQQITKRDGVCTNNCDTITCSFWENNKKHSICTLFTKEVIKGNSLDICNAIYGLDFTGNP